MDNHGGIGNGRDRGSSLSGYETVRRSDLEGSTEGLAFDRLSDLVSYVDPGPGAPTTTADAQQAEAEAAERAKAATEAGDEIARSALAVTDPAATKDTGPGTPEVVDADAAGVGSAAGILTLAQKLHDEYVAEGQNTRERLISEGQSHHDQVVGEATARHEELLSTGQAKYDQFISVGEAEAAEMIAKANADHDNMITEARERSTGMVAEAEQKRAEVYQRLSRERSSLQKEIEELRIFERDHRAHLKAYLEGQLSELVQTPADEPAVDPG